jgi:cellulose synthase/poly-beta-1,6-N-acetylglucosamine synthase-like glycosyltransferase
MAAVIALTLIAAILAVPAAVLFVQCVLAALPLGRGPLDRSTARPSLGILVPAHNESAVLAATLQSIDAQLDPADRLLVVADNCTDNTAEIARANGAEVIERQNVEQRGKGYALAAGLTALAGAPTELVAIIDADCQLADGCLSALARTAAIEKRPVQGVYLMPPPADPRPNDVVSALAVLVKNQVRPLGMWKLRQPCLITGSGVVFPWGVLTPEAIAGGNIVEDMQLAVDLTLDGKGPLFCPDAMLAAPLPDKEAAFVSQRTRWEHGHLQTLLTQCPRLLWGFLRTGRIGCLAMMLDLCVPPLSLLVMSSGAVWILAVIFALVSGELVPAAIASASIILIASGILLAWLCFGRRQFPARILLSVPGYIVGKLPLYAGFLYRRQTAWVRTRRSSQP